MNKKIKQIENILINAGIEPNEAKIETKMLVKSFCGLSDVDIVLGRDFDFDLVIEKAKLRAETLRPIQHIIGFSTFMGEKFIVNENVLIPRDETEILVRKICEIINSCSLKSGLDIGTGSGCISCMIAKMTQAMMLGVDISSNSLQVAIKNCEKLGLQNKALFRKSDLFSNVANDEKFDFIVSNPPYIPFELKNELQKEVGYEPEIALFASDKCGVDFYRRIVSKSADFLNKGGYLFFELGINQSEIVSSIMIEKGFSEINIVKDLAGIKRVIFAKLKN